MLKSFLVYFTTLAAIIISVAVASASPVRPKVNPLNVLSGFWYTEGHDGGIQLYPCGDKICGRFYWMKSEKGDDDEGGVSRDTHNPNPALRTQPLCHMQFMGDFTPDKDGHYTDGWIYNPRDGGKYSAEMTLINSNTLKLRGYLFFEFLGESQIWTRAKSLPDCATSG